MAEGNVQLKLQASLDLAFLRAQVASLGKSLKADGVSVVATLNTKQFEKDVAKLRKEVRVNINDTQVQLLSQRLQKAQEQLAAFKAADNKVTVGVTVKSAVTKRDARKVRSDVYRGIMQNGGKILLPVGLQPISQTAVNAFKADLQKKLGTINIKVGTTTGTASATGQGGGSRRPSYLDAPAFKTELEKLSRATFAQLQKGASGLREGRTRAELERLLSEFAQTNPQGAQRSRDLNALREMLARGRYQQGLGIEARMAGGSGRQGGQFQRTLDTFARGLFRMLGMDPAQLRAERQARLAPPAINWPSQVPQRNIPVGPSSTGRALPGAAPLTPIAGTPSPFGILPSITRRTQVAQGVNAIMQGTGAAGGEDPAGKLALSAEALRRRVDAILAQYFKVVEAQIREEFGGADLRQGLRAFAYVAQALRDAEQRTKQARIDDAVASFLRSVENAVRLAEARATRFARVSDLGNTVRALPPARAQLMLPPAGGSGFRGGGGFVPPGGFPSDGLQGPRRPLPGGPRTDLPRAYTAGGRMAGALGGADQFLRRSRVPLAGAIEELGGEFAQATKQVLLYGTAYKGLAFFMDLPSQALSAATALQTFRNQLNAVTGSADNVNRSFSFIDGLAERFAVPLASVRQGFVRMYASMEPAGFGASEIEGLFSGISKAAATFGMSRELVDRVTYAFSQMASKGQIMAEELRGQLGDVLPGSLALFAKAAQMELPEFTKAMEDGRFSGEAMRVVLNNVAILLNQQFAKGAEGAAKTLQGALNQMQNNLQKLYEAFEPLVNQVAQQAFPLISSAVSDATKAVQAFTATMGGSEAQAAQLTGMARQVYDTMRQLTEIGQAVVGVVASLGPVLENAGRLFLFVTQQIARLINTPLGGALSNWLALTILLTAAMRTLALIGVLLLGRQLMMLVRQLALVAAGLRTTITLSASARLGLLGLGAAAVIAAIMAVGTALDSTNRKLEQMSARSRQAAQDIMAMAAAGDVAGVQAVEQESRATALSLERSKQVLERIIANPRAIVTEQEFEDLRSKGLASGLGRIGVGRSAGQVIGSAGQLKANFEAAKLAWQEQLNKWGEAESNVKTAVQRAVEMQKPPALQAIPPDTGDADTAAKERAKAAQDAEKLDEAARRRQAQLQNQEQQRILQNADLRAKLEELGFNQQKTLKEEALNLAKETIDAEFDYRLSKANEIQAVQLRLEKQLAASRLSAATSVENALLRMQEARLRTGIANQRLEAAKQFDALQEQQDAVTPSTLPGAPSAPVLPPPAGGVGGTRLSRLIGSVESYGGNYGAFNRGGSNQGHTAHGSGIDPSLVNMTIAEIQRRQLAPNVPRSQHLHAVGKYQIIGTTLRSLMQGRYGETGVTPSDRFTPEAQERLGYALARNRVQGRSVGQAMTGLRQEWIGLQNVRDTDLRQAVVELQQGGGQWAAPSAPVSGPSFSVEKRTQGAEDELQVAQQEEQATSVITLIQLSNELQKAMQQARVDIAQAIGATLPVEQLRLENELLAKRSDLLLQGVPDEVIEGEEKRLVALRQSEGLQAAINDNIARTETKLSGYRKELEKGGPNQAFYAEAIKQTEANLAIQREELARVSPELQRYNLEILKNTLAQLQNADALKRVRETIETIERVVGDAMGSYKDFLVNVARGEGLTKSLKEFQNALRDQALTLFFDFAMKPMQKFLEDSLLKVFGLESEEQQRQKSLAKLQEQINLLSQIRDNTAKVSGPTSGMSETGQSLGLSSYAGSRAGGISELPQVQSALKMASQIPSQINSLPNTMEQASQALQGFQMKTALVTTALKQQSTDAGASGAALQQNLGKTVSAIGLAAGAITSIAGGISQVKEGGISGVLGGIGSIFMGVGGALGGFNSMFPGLFAPKTAANGALWKGGFTPFANGGVVNGPTLGLVGEGKYNEAIVPLPDGRSIPVKMAGGQSAREAMSNGGMPSYAPSTVSFSFETTKINGVEYVSRDQLELAMASTRREAIKEGAKRGMSMTLDRIQQSPVTRRSIAMGRR